MLRPLLPGKGHIAGGRYCHRYSHLAAEKQGSSRYCHAYERGLTNTPPHGPVLISLTARPIVTSPSETARNGLPPPTLLTLLPLLLLLL